MYSLFCYPIIGTSCKTVVQNHNQDTDFDTVKRKNKSITSGSLLLILLSPPPLHSCLLFIPNSYQPLTCSPFLYYWQFKNIIQTESQNHIAWIHVFPYYLSFCNLWYVVISHFISDLVGFLSFFANSFRILLISIIFKNN